MEVGAQITMVELKSLKEMTTPKHFSKNRISPPPQGGGGTCCKSAVDTDTQVSTETDAEADSEADSKAGGIFFGAICLNTVILPS